MGHKFEEKNWVRLFSKNNKRRELKTSKRLKFMMLCFVKTTYFLVTKGLLCRGHYKTDWENKFIIIEESQSWFHK